MVHSVLAVFFFKGTSTHRSEPGLSTYLALTFGTLLSSQGTEASFAASVLNVAVRAPPGFPFVVPSLADPISRFRHPLEGACRFAFAFRRFRLYQTLSGLTPGQRAFVSRLPA